MIAAAAAIKKEGTEIMHTYYVDFMDSDMTILAQEEIKAVDTINAITLAMSVYQNKFGSTDEVAAISIQDERVPR